MVEKPPEKPSATFAVLEGIFRTIGILIKWGGGWLVAWHVLPAFSGKSSAILVNAVVSWSLGKDDYLFALATILAIGWALLERGRRKKAIVVLRQMLESQEKPLSPERLPTAGKSDGSVPD